MTVAVEPLLAVLQADAEAVATLLRQRRGDRQARRRARALLATSFRLLQPPSSEGNQAENAVEDVATHKGVCFAEAFEAARELASVRRALGDGALAGARRIADLWIRTPMPDRIRRLVFVQRRVQLVEAIAARSVLPLALNDERIDWMEARCRVDQPGVVKPVTTRDDAESERLLASELELLRKRGRSRFS